MIPEEANRYLLDFGTQKRVDAEFQKQKPVNIKIKDLTVTQEFVFENPLKNSKGDKSVYVIKYRGKNYLVDGNHTASKRALSGEETVKALILTLK